jgi:DNA-binding HxlR family transcriptional regulator
MIFVGKWKASILWYLSLFDEGRARYGELKRRIPWTISHKMFAQQLHELEADGMVDRREYDDAKVKVVEYQLTEKARLLMPALQYMRDWCAIYEERFGPDVIRRSRGERTEDGFKYGCTSTSDSGMSVSIEYNLGEHNNDF